MRIAVGADHRGFRLKQVLASALREWGHQVADVGTHDEESVDYPDIALRVAEAVSRGEADLGVLVCGTGIGMSITANKVPGVRAALCAEPFSARMARAHNNANVICLGGGILGPWLAVEVLRAFLEAEFEGGRHARRVGKISRVEALHLRAGSVQGGAGSAPEVGR